MSKSRLLYTVLSLSCGVFMFIYGGYDDSPGGQLLGVLLVGAGLYSFFQYRS